MSMKQMLAHTRQVLALVAVLLLAGCGGDPDPLTADGFVLPKGNADHGLAVFLEQGCRQCHEVAGLELPAYDGVVSLQIELGGKRARIKDYGELLTSVVNPDHVLSDEYKKMLNKAEEAKSDSPMPDFTERLSVRDLINIVQFLHSRYEELVPEYRGYSYTIGP